MALSAKIKTALDETRMLILGAQILLGFQFRSAFSDGFDDLPKHAHLIDMLALGFMVGAIACLMAPGPYHRIVEEGNDSGPFHCLVTTFADIALLPFAVAFGLDVFVTAEQIVGRTAGAAAGIAATVLAVGLWYVLPRVRRRFAGQGERSRAMQQRDERQKTPLHTKIEQMLTEARVILPGAQALFGFQLAIVLTKAFQNLPETLRTVHAVSIGLLAVSVMLLMAPAAYHRIVYEGEDALGMHRAGSIMVTAALLPLALGLSGDVYVVIAKTIGDRAGVLSGILAAVLLIGLWYVFPVAARWAGRGTAAHRYSERPAE